jgi:hypothetical protein
MTSFFLASSIGARDDSSALLYAFEACKENAYIDLRSFVFLFLSRPDRD